MKEYMNDPVDYDWSDDEIRKEYNKYPNKKSITKAFRITTKELNRILAEQPDVKSVLKDFGELICPSLKFSFRAVCFRDDTYGIIQNNLSSDCTARIGLCNILFYGLSYEDMYARWEEKKNRKEITWRNIDNE